MTFIHNHQPRAPLGDVLAKSVSSSQQIVRDQEDTGRLQTICVVETSAGKFM